jgi:hypothetical protein
MKYSSKNFQKEYACCSCTRIKLAFQNRDLEVTPLYETTYKYNFNEKLWSKMWRDGKFCQT